MSSKLTDSPSTLSHRPPCPCTSNTSQRPAADCRLGCTHCRLGIPAVSKLTKSIQLDCLKSVATNLGDTFQHPLYSCEAVSGSHLLALIVPHCRPNPPSHHLHSVVSITAIPSETSRPRSPPPLNPTPKASVPISPNAQPRQRKATWQRHGGDIGMEKRGDEDGDGITFGAGCHPMSKTSRIHAVFSSHIENSMITFLPTCAEPPCDPHPPLGTLPVLNTRQSKQTTKEAVSASLHLKRPSQKQNHQVEILCPHSTTPSLQQTTSNFQHSPPLPPPSPHPPTIPSRPSQCYPNPPLPHPPTHTCTAIKRNSNNVALYRPPDRDEIPVSRPTMQCDAMRSSPVRTAHHPVQGSGRGTGRYSLENKVFGLLRRVRREVVQYLHMCRRIGWLAGWLVGWLS